MSTYLITGVAGFIGSALARGVIAQGDKVVVLGRSEAKVKSTGRMAATDWVHVFTVRDQKVTNFTELFDSAAVTRAYQKAATA